MKFMTRGTDGGRLVTRRRTTSLIGDDVPWTPAGKTLAAGALLAGALLALGTSRGPRKAART